MTRDREMRIPISSIMAGRIGVERDVDGFATVRMLLDPDKMGKFVSFVADAVTDCEADIPLILTRENMFDRVKENDLFQLGQVTDPLTYARLLRRLARSADYWNKNVTGYDDHWKPAQTPPPGSLTRLEIMEKHFLVRFQWEPLDLITMTPEVWLMTQCSKMRQLGLIYSIGTHTPPLGVMESMGSKLVALAIEIGLLSDNVRQHHN